MNFKPQLTLLLLCLFSQVCLANSNCADAYTSASYALSHSKKAFQANNFDHQQYYAGRALEALEKTRDLVNGCGCEVALISIGSGLENLEKALDPKDWDMGRYFTKRAIADTYAVLENLDLCTMSEGTSTSNPKNNSNESDSNPSRAGLRAEHIKALKDLESAALTELKQLDLSVKNLGALLDCEVSDFSFDQLRAKYEGTAYPESLKELQDQLAADARTLYQKALEAIEERWEN